MHLPTEVTEEKRAPKNGEDLYGKFFKAGEFLPFYVPRDRMPQIDEQYLPELLVFAKVHGVNFTAGMKAPKLFRAHQRIDFNRAKVIPAEVLEKPCLASSDGYMLDGNHRWLGHVFNGSDVPYFQLDLPFDKAIPWLFTFPKTYSYGDGKFHPITY